MRHLVAGLDDGALAFAERLVRGDELGGDDPIVGVGFTVIVEAHHRELPGKRQERPDMIAVVVRRPHVIDAREAGGLEGLDNPGEIAIAAIPGIDEQ